jgi:hypothetical protein
MSGSRYFSGEGPERPHLARGEVLDLRNDVESAFKRVEEGAGLEAVLEAVQPLAGVNTAVVRVRFPGRTAPVVFEFAAFDDEDGATPATNGTLGTETIGTILAGGPGPALKVKTATSGSDQVFQCALTNPVDESNFLTAFTTPTGPVISCVGSLEVAFTA